MLDCSDVRTTTDISTGLSAPYYMYVIYIILLLLLLCARGEPFVFKPPAQPTLKPQVNDTLSKPLSYQ